MIDGKLTQKDVTEWCSFHVCNEHDCEYMRGYCHIREHVVDECNECTRGYCRDCKNYK